MWQIWAFEFGLSSLQAVLFFNLPINIPDFIVAPQMNSLFPFHLGKSAHNADPPSNCLWDSVVPGLNTVRDQVVLEYSLKNNRTVRLCSQALCQCSRCFNSQQNQRQNPLSFAPLSAYLASPEFRWLSSSRLRLFDAITPQHYGELSIQALSWYTAEVAAGEALDPSP